MADTMIRVKICGIRSFENALMVADAGADLLGLNFYPETPRYLEPLAARDLVSRLRDQLASRCPVLVGVFVNTPADQVRKVVDYVGLDCAQLSGDETLAAVKGLRGLAFKAIRPKDVAAALADSQNFAESFPEDSAFPSILVDAFHAKLYGGTGETASTSVALAVRDAVPRLMLAGGLNPRNVAERARAIQPWAVDVASGVEDGTPGLKDERKVRQFIADVRAASE